MSDSIVTEYWLANNFTPKSGITPGTSNTRGLDCDEITSRYQVDVTGATTSGNRLPSQDQISDAAISLAINDSYAGGRIAYIYKSGDSGYVLGEQHGIIVREQDEVSSRNWADAKSIVEASTFGGYTNWVLPSRFDLQSIVDYHDAGYGAFGSNYYWSREESGSYAYANFINSGAETTLLKTSTAYVRGVRYF